MPEYLSPGVYVEEVNTGSKPIEGVSTSTAGMVGVTERGPENVPVLVTSYGEYRRVFGGELRLADFTDGAGRVHGYLPHAVQGFFQNDGRRNYVVRVAPEDARVAARNLFDRGDQASADTMLLRAAPQDSGTAVNLPLLYALNVGALANNEWIRVGEGSRSEYRQIAGIGTQQRHIALNFPLGLAHTGALSVTEVERTIDTLHYTTGDFQIVGGANAGATSIVVAAVGTAADAVALLNLPGDAVFEIGLVPGAEYVVATAADDLGSGNVRLTLATPLASAYVASTAVNAIEIVRRIVDTTNYTTGDFQIVGGASAGDTVITVTPATTPGDGAVLVTLPGDAIFQIGTGAGSEYKVATVAADAGGGNVDVTLSTPLTADYNAGDPVNAMQALPAATSATLDIDASAGDSLIYVDSLGGGFPNGAVVGTSLVVVDSGSAGMEVRRLGTLSQLDLDLPAYVDYDTGTRFERVTMADHTAVVVTPALPAVNTATAFYVDSVEGFAVGMQIDVNGDPGVISDIDDANDQITLQSALAGGTPAAADVVTPQAKLLTADVAAGRVAISLDNRLGLQADDVLRIGAGVDVEYVTVASIGGERGVAPDAGTVILTSPLQQGFAAGTQVARQLIPIVDNTVQPAISVLPVEQDSGTVYVNDGVGYAAGDIVRATLPTGTVYYHELSGVDTTLAPREITLNAVAALDFSHDAGAPVVEREALIEVYALDRGAWGNRLLVSVDDPESSLVQAGLTAANGLNPVISLSNYTNVEAGTVLEFFHPVTGAQLGTPAKVISVDRAAGEVELAAIPDPAVVTAFNTLTDNVQVRSREFLINVFLLQRPDPAVPSRNRTIIDSESFLVTMDPRHSRYIHRVIGTTWTPGSENDDDGHPLRLWDLRSEGESAYIRVRDVAAGNAAELESIRLGPEVLIDVLDNGQEQAARLPLNGGVDGFDSIINAAQGDNIYLGVDSDEPRLRTGIPVLRNITDISIVAVPGQTTVGVQQALINHCEDDRYRFAVLDALAPNRDTLADVQNQRQNYDTNYASLYHPWLTIPEPLPANIAAIKQLAIPPSGHMMGIYARTDNTRGVHKAPANEVVRGITGLTRNLNTREQDLLNPFPKNINVIRDFRDANRGLRVWGARCITSDSDYKYINVRRLLIFLEASIDRGLQWVVFEPNAEPLWARVRRAITNFLNVVWRNGALEGTTPEQAFFVKCDRTTMTQTDIDNGRLICEIGVAPVKPAEFVIVRIGLWTASAD